MQDLRVGFIIVTMLEQGRGGLKVEKMRMRFRLLILMIRIVLLSLFVLAVTSHFTFDSSTSRFLFPSFSQKVRILALVCIIRSESFDKQGLLDYNVDQLREGIINMMKN